MRDERDGLKSAYSGDGVHPNKLGYQIMAPLAEKAIKEVLVEK
jgi:lysophospholipase L1-like esterase